MSKDGESTFRINIDGNASVASKDVAVSARLAAKSIGEFENEAKTLSAEIRRLKGNSDDVTAAKSALKKRLEEVKSSASALTVELAKQGTTYKAAAEAAKKYGTTQRLPNLRKGAAAAIAATTKAVSPAVAKAAKAIAPATKKLGELFAPVAKAVATKLAPAGKAVSKFGSGAKVALNVGKAAAEDLGSVLPSLGSVMGLLGTGAAAVAAAVLFLATGLIAGAAAIGAFGLASAAAASKMQLQREALLGNAKDAKALGEQIAVLAGKVPQGVAELNELSRELSKTRLSGKAIVDTMGAVAQATGAVDASAGAKLQELLTRGQMTGRFYLGQFELQGTGIDFDDVAKELAAGTKKSVAAVRGELMRGEVSIDKAAEALKNVTQKKFGDINLKNAFSLENGPKKLKEQLSILSSGVDLTPISKALQEAFGQLSPEAPLGRAVKTFMESTGTGLVDIAAKSIPILVEGLTWLVAAALRVGIAYYEMKKTIKEAFAKEDWVGVGQAILKGMAEGVLGAGGILVKAIKGTALSAMSAFENEMKIHSPSKVFEGYGRNTVEGYVQGVDRASSKVDGAMQRMAPSAPASNINNSRSSESIEIHFHNAPSNVSEMVSPSFLAQLTSAVRDARTNRGLVPA